LSALITLFCRGGKDVSLSVCDADAILDILGSNCDPVRLLGHPDLRQETDIREIAMTNLCTEDARDVWIMFHGTRPDGKGKSRWRKGTILSMVLERVHLQGKRD
jgi:hypothetical protein